MKWFAFFFAAAATVLGSVQASDSPVLSCGDDTAIALKKLPEYVPYASSSVFVMKGTGKPFQVHVLPPASSTSVAKTFNKNFASKFKKSANVNSNIIFHPLLEKARWKPKASKSKTAHREEEKDDSDLAIMNIWIETKQDGDGEECLVELQAQHLIHVNGKTSQFHSIVMFPTQEDFTYRIAFQGAESEFDLLVAQFEPNNDCDSRFRLQTPFAGEQKAVSVIHGRTDKEGTDATDIWYDLEGIGAPVKIEICSDPEKVRGSFDVSIWQQNAADCGDMVCVGTGSFEKHHFGDHVGPRCAAYNFFATAETRFAIQVHGGLGGKHVPKDSWYSMKVSSFAPVPNDECDNANHIVQIPMTFQESTAFATPDYLDTPFGAPWPHVCVGPSRAMSYGGTNPGVWYVIQDDHDLEEVISATITGKPLSISVWSGPDCQDLRLVVHKSNHEHSHTATETLNVSWKTSKSEIDTDDKWHYYILVAGRHDMPIPFEMKIELGDIDDPLAAW